AMKQVAGSLRLDLASFRELEAFAQLGTDLDPVTQRQLDRGYRMVEILKQPEGKPMDVIDQVMIIFAGSQAVLDKVKRSDVLDWQNQFLKFMHEQQRAVVDRLMKERKFDQPKDPQTGKSVSIDKGEIGKALLTAIAAFQGQWDAAQARKASPAG